HPDILRTPVHARLDLTEEMRCVYAALRELQPSTYACSKKELWRCFYSYFKANANPVVPRSRCTAFDLLRALMHQMPELASLFWSIRYIFSRPATSSEKDSVTNPELPAGEYVYVKLEVAGAARARLLGFLLDNLSSNLLPKKHAAHGKGSRRVARPQLVLRSQAAVQMFASEAARDGCTANEILGAVITDSRNLLLDPLEE